MSDARQPQAHSANSADVFCGATSPALARVYARWTGDERAGHQLSGTLTGPSCLYAGTLPATSRFVDRGPGGPPLAEAVVPEPTFWTPHMPHLYEAELELQSGQQTVARLGQVFGFRSLAVAGKKLRLDGKNWVLRGVASDHLSEVELHECHVSDTALVLQNPDEAVCAAASRIGVLIVAELDRPSVTDIRRLNRWPAVSILSLPADVSPDLSTLGHNLLLAQRVAAGEPLSCSAWADLLIRETSDADRWDTGAAALPIIVSHRAQGRTISDGRAACDRLQATLALHGQFAGYIV